MVQYVFKIGLIQIEHALAANGKGVAAIFDPARAIFCADYALVPCYLKSLEVRANRAGL